MIFTVWLLVLLSIFSAAVGYHVRQRLRYIQTVEIREKLRAAADAGLRKAVQMAMLSVPAEADGLGSRWASSPRDFKNIPAGEGFFSVSYKDASGETVYGLIDEERKINLHKIRSQGIIARILESAGGLEKAEASDLAASIADWIDEDDAVNAGGAESRYYRTQSPPHTPKNAPLDHLEELLMVKGMTPDLLLKAAPFITIHGSGRVNLNTASEKVLIAMGLNENQARSIVRFREGKDGRKGTPDDRLITSRPEAAEELANTLSLTSSEIQSLSDFIASGQFTTKSSHFIAHVTANLSYRKEVLDYTCIISHNGVINYCKEYYYRTESPPDNPSHMEQNDTASAA